MALIYEEKTSVIRKCLSQVHSKVGVGRHEKAYHRALEICFEENEVPFLSKPQHSLYLDGKIVHVLIPDFVLWESITLEIKAKRRRFQDSDFVQIFEYLKFRRDLLGLLVNFGLERMEMRRFAYRVPDYGLEEDFQQLQDSYSNGDRRLGEEIRQVFLEIFEVHGTGYGETITRELILTALEHRRLDFIDSPEAKAYYGDHVVDESPLDCILVEGIFLLTYSALLEDNKFNVSRGVSCLKVLDCKLGIAVNFGKKVLQLSGYRNPSG